MTTFLVVGYQDELLPAGGSTVDAIVTIGVTGAPVEAALRVWTPESARLTLLREAAPAVVDVTGRSSKVDDRTDDYPVGTLDAGERDYHVRVDVVPRAPGEELLAARVGLVVDGAVVGEALVRAVWTDDDPTPTRATPVGTSGTAPP